MNHEWRRPMLAVLVLAGLVAAGPLGAAPVECTPDAVAPDTSARTSELRAWLKKQAQAIGWAEEGGHLLGGDPPPIDTLDVLTADVDNDGAEEHVLVSREGSGNFLSMWIFRSSGEGFSWVRGTPLDEQMTGGHEYSDRLSPTWRSQLVVRLCGTTYITFREGRLPNFYPLAYVWKDGRATLACDTAWLKWQRSVFRKLFDEKKYDAAHGLLDGVQGACAATADSDLWLWMRSDLALTAHRLRAFDQCLEHVLGAEKSAGWAHAGVAVKKALATNASLCREAQARAAGGASPDYDFSWLRDELLRDPEKQIVLDARFDGLLSAIVPEAKVEKEPLRDALKRSIWLPDPAAFIAGNRYLVLSGCEPHNCTNRGSIWIDLVSKKSIIAAGGVLASTTVAASEIPAAFWEHVPQGSGVDMDYIGPGGKQTQIKTP